MSKPVVATDGDMDAALALGLEIWRAENPGIDHLVEPAWTASTFWVGSWVTEHYELTREYLLAGMAHEVEAEMSRRFAANPDLDPYEVRNEAAARVLAERQPGPPH